MIFTRTQARGAVIFGVLGLAGCGDDKGGTGDTAGETPGITSATMTNPTSAPTGTPETEGATTEATDASSGTDGVSGSTAVEPTTAGPVSTESTGLPVDSTTTLGTTEDSTVGSETSSSTDAPPKFDMMVFPDVEEPVCLQCALTIASQQSGTFAIGGQAVFATAQLQGDIVYALGTWGSGRFIATADSSLPFNEVTDCPLSEWLASNGGIQPKILYFGWGPSDGPKNWNVPSDAAGVHMPPQYVGNPALLLQDYDIVMYLEGSGQFDDDQPTDQEMDTLLDYIAMGGGMYISSEFYGYMTDMDLASVNRVLTPLGVTSEPVSLNWGNVDGNIEFDCFPAPQ